MARHSHKQKLVFATEDTESMEVVILSDVKNLIYQNITKKDIETHASSIAPREICSGVAL